MGGISAGVLFRKAGIETFTIYESSERVGGTWWDNQYPGAEVDVDSYIYSFPFKRHDWTRTHARQAEIHRYLEETVSEFGLASHLRLGTGVQRAVWDDDRHVYRLTLTDGEERDCHVLVSAVGFLNVPYYPDWPGLDDFRGPCFHTSRWEHQHDLTGKTVAVVGTGSTASQLVPALAADRRQDAPLPAGAGLGVAEGRPRLHRGGTRCGCTTRSCTATAAAKWYWATEKRLWNGGAYRPGAPAHTAAEDAARRYIAKVFADRPDLAVAVTPNYPFWGKRTIFSSDFYPALKQPNVELVPRAVASITARGVVDVDGVERDADVLVLSTGFQPTNYLAHLEVVGRTGDSIQKYWDGEPRAFLGVTVPTFPNFYMLYGPGTNGGEIALNLRNQAAYARRAVKRMMPRRRHRDRGEAVVGRSVPRVAACRRWTTPRGRCRNNYFTTERGEDRHAVALQRPRLRRPAQDPGAAVRAGQPPWRTRRRPALPPLRGGRSGRRRGGGTAALRAMVRFEIPELHHAATVPALLASGAERFGDDDYVITATQRLSFREADEQSALLARQLLAAGVGKGTRVGIVLPSGTEFAVAFLAVARIGADRDALQLDLPSGGARARAAHRRRRHADRAPCAPGA